MREKVAGAKALLQSVFDQVVLAMSSVPRYRNQTLSDLSHLVIDPLINDRIAIATGKSAKPGEPAAIAIWASVSETVDSSIKEQINAGVFPVRLKQKDWNSGSITRLLDVIAPTREMATTVLAQVNQVAKQEAIKIHPIVAQLVDREALVKLQAQMTGKMASTEALN